MSEPGIHLARDGNVTCHNFRSHGYQRLSRGVYGHQPDVDGLDKYEARRVRFLRRVRALTALSAGSTFALYGATALQVMGVALPSSAEDWDNCHIVVPRGAYRPQRPGLIVHEAKSGLEVIRRVAGLPILNPVDHWVQLRGASLDELTEVGDGLVRRQRPLMTIDAINQRLKDLSGTPGIGPVRRAARWVVPGTDSLYETRVRTIMRHAGLPTPAVDVPVYIRATGITNHLDLGYEEEQVGVEFDGLVHVGSRRQMEIDAARHRDLQDEGWYVVKVTSGQLGNPAQFLGPIERALIMRQGR
ncbi:MAG: hypothetical protein FWF28_02795 [Micrococcales bacterium]|nr:hypothetical protein [Micrococcales bacterium]